MSESETPLDPDSVAAAWDYGAAAYDEFQRSGADHYRLAFLGPAQVHACGDVADRDVLDVGCGAGYLARELARRGARVRGVDISTEMIRHALRHEMESPLGIRYTRLDAAEIGSRFAASSFDLVASCLALQDMPAPDLAVLGTYRVLRPGGRFVASITHPCTDTPYRNWARFDDGRKRALEIDRYFDVGPIEYHWVRMHYVWKTPALHATLSDWFGWVLDAGFRLERVLEPRPDEAALREHADLEDAARVPYYLLFVARKPG